MSAVSDEMPASGVHEEHRQIFEAVMARDADRADEVVANHISLALNVIRRLGKLR